MKHHPRIAVVGAGLGGLACAARLARAGASVDLFEKNATPGGKMQILSLDGFTWDMGPSLLTMPEVLRELWTDLGACLEDDLDLIPLPVTCRYRWTDGTQIDENAAFWQRPEVAAFLRYAAGLYDISADAFLYHRIEDWHRQLTLANLPKLRHFPKIASPRTLHSMVSRYFSDPHLVQLFDRFATYNGSSPWRTPSAFNIIPYVQHRFGGWYPRGGMGQIAHKLHLLAEKTGVRFLFNHEISRLAPSTDGTWLVDDQPYDRVFCNADVLTAHETLLPEKERTRFRRSHLDHLDVSMSGYILFLGIDKKYPGLEHHNIFFSDDYRAEFRQLEAGQPADEPTIYIASNSRTEDQRGAPAGCDNWFVLINMPAGSRVPEGYGDRILHRLETRFGFENLQSHIRVRREFTPDDFAHRDRAWLGSLYGFASHGTLTAFRRPAMEPKTLPGLHFVGGTTHPGGGVPLVLLSGKIAAERILNV